MREGSEMKLAIVLGVCFAALMARPASADVASATVVAACGAPSLTYAAGGFFPLTQDVNGKLCINSSGGTSITGNAAGSTGAVVGTLAGVAAKTTYICGFNVQAIGGTAAVGPITVAGLIGSSQVYQGSATTQGGLVAGANFTPCIPASAVNTPITVTTTADGTATAVDVNSWGFQQ